MFTTAFVIRHEWRQCIPVLAARIQIGCHHRACLGHAVHHPNRNALCQKPLACVKHERCAAKEDIRELTQQVVIGSVLSDGLGHLLKHEGWGCHQATGIHPQGLLDVFLRRRRSFDEDKAAADRQETKSTGDTKRVKAERDKSRNKGKIDGLTWVHRTKGHRPDRWPSSRDAFVSWLERYG